MDGPPQELRDLFIASNQRLVVAVAAITGSVDEAEECVAEAFARAAARWRRLHAYDDPEGWIRHVALNVARSRWRLARRSLQRPRATATVELPVEHVEVLAALRQLPQPQREAIALHYLLDMSTAEVARVQQVAVGTVKARLSRARAALSELLRDEAEMTR